MVRVEMLTVGKELLIGRTVNTNAHWAGGRLARLGSMLKEVTTVDDDLGEIGRATRDILGRDPDFLVVVGGLGPTPDDMTLEGLAGALRVRVLPNRRALEMIRAHYVKRGLANLELTPARRKMALLPEGAEPVANRVGTAPGVRISSGKTVIYSLPGVPKEMRSIFRLSVEPELRKSLGELHRSYIKFKLEGIMESALAPMIAEALKKHPAAYIKSHPRGVEKGVSKVELDIAVIGEAMAKVDGEAEAVGRELKDQISRAGAIIKTASTNGRKGGRELKRS